MPSLTGNPPYRNEFDRSSSMKKKMIGIFLLSLALIAIGYEAFIAIRNARIDAQVNKEIQNTVYAKVGDIGSTKKLIVLPLFEEAASRDGLIAAHGVSYLIYTDQTTILFDAGFDTSILQHNMQQLGISIKDIDAIVISHDHPDHVGGYAWWPNHTFSLMNTQPDLGSIPVYVPEEMNYPSLRPILAAQPQKIAAGVYSMGTIPYREVASMSKYQLIRTEQALAVNVEGMGIVIISGCGHPGVQNMFNRAAMLFDTPVVGMIGGLHYENKNKSALQGDIELLQAHHLRLLSISPHDSEPATIQIFREAFPEIYQDLAVGREINIQKATIP